MVVGLAGTAAAQPRGEIISAAKVVAHSYGSMVVLGIDEEGKGVASRVYLISTAQAQKFELRAAATTVIRAGEHLAVLLPDEKRVLDFVIEGSTPLQIEKPPIARELAAGETLGQAVGSAAGKGRQAKLGIDPIAVRRIISYEGVMRTAINLYDIERWDVSTLFPDVEAKDAPQQGTVQQPKCGTSCSYGCTGGGSCSATAGSGQCCTCTCNGSSPSCSCA